MCGNRPFGANGITGLDVQVDAAGLRFSTKFIYKYCKMVIANKGERSHP